MPVPHHHPAGVSVLVPVYCPPGADTEAFAADLAAAVRSVADQPGAGPLDIVCVDDGSATPVAELLARQGLAGLPGLRITRHPRNYGLVHALNTALALADHDLVARIDADDRWLPGKLARQLARLAADPDLTILGTGMRIAADPPADHVRPGDWHGILRFFEEVGCPFPHGSIVARRRVMRALGGYAHDPGVRHCEDYALWGLWLRFFKPAMLEEILFEYRPSRGSVSTLHAAWQRRASGAVNRRFAALPRRHEIPELLAGLAGALGVSLTEAGLVALSLWRSDRLAVALPAAAVAPLAALLSDRVLVPASAAGLPDVYACLDPAPDAARPDCGAAVRVLA